MKKKCFSLFVVLAMIVSLFSGLTLMASAEDTLTAYDGQTTSGNYSISTPDQLVTLATKVNSGTTYQGSKFFLTDDIDLTGINWIPIGGRCGEDNNYVPSGNGFQGVFTGYDGTSIHEITNLNMNLSATTSTKAGYGLFGYVNGGAIGNLVVSGNISVSGSAEYVGGIVGYSNGNIYNCDSQVVISAPNSSNVGGIAGAVERRSSTAVSVKYCKNKSTVTGSKRVGGICGGVYSVTNGIVTLDSCANEAAVTANGSQKVYAGGVAGYTRGTISHCYNTGSVTASNGRYVGGITGLLNGYSLPYAVLSNSYSSAASVSGVADARALYGTADNSVNPQITNTFWLDINGLSQDTTGNWGTVTMVQSVTADQLKEAEGAYIADSHLITYYLNNNSDNHDYFKVVNGTNPTLVNVDNSAYVVATSDLTVAGAEGHSTTTDNTEMIFVDRTEGVDQEGTAANIGMRGNPVATLAKAETLLSEDRNVIYFLTDIPVTDELTVDYSDKEYDVTIMRSDINHEHLFDVQSGGVLTLGDVILDGNKDNVLSAGGSLVNVQAGTVSIQGATLQNNFANAGGAVRIVGGTTTMSSGVIRYNKSSNSGGGVMVAASTLTSGDQQPPVPFTMTGGTISENRAGTFGGGISVTSFSNAVVGSSSTDTPVISGNVAQTYGGGVAVNASLATNSSFTMNSGTIRENQALYGSGLAVWKDAAFLNRRAVANLNGGKIIMNVTRNYNSAPNALNVANYGGGIYAGTGSSVTLSGTTIGGTSEEANLGAYGSGAYVKNGAVFTLNSSNGIAADQIVYLANTSGNSDAYITLQSQLISQHTIQCANPSEEIIVAHITEDDIQNSAMTYLSCANSGFTVARSSAFLSYDVVLAATES